jgi:hypothetical protein
VARATEAFRVAANASPTEEGREAFLRLAQPVVDSATYELIAGILALEGSGDHTLRRELGDQQYFDLTERILSLDYHGKMWEAPLHLILQNPSEKQGG